MKSAQLDAVAKEVLDRHERLSADRADRLEQRAALLRELRDLDRALMDCRATARFFGIEDRLPQEDERSDLARRELDMRNARVHGMSLGEDYMRNSRGELVRVHRNTALLPPDVVPPPSVPAKVQVVEGARDAVRRDVPRPPLKEFLLRQLQLIGKAGAKAAGLRAAFQQEFHTEIHEKTVGMTLYRLSRDSEVHRRGHFWFYGRDPDQHQQQAGGAE